MANLEDPRKRAAEERKVRIDHSDVYLENEKLSDELNTRLDTLSRRRHRQVINRDHEIKQLRHALSSMNVTKTASAVTSLRPHTAIPSLRHLKPQPTVDRVQVHVPTANKDDDSSSTSQSSGDDSDAIDGRVHTGLRNTKLRTRGQRRSGVAWRKEGQPGTKSIATSPSKPEVNKVTKEQMLLNSLDMEAIPNSWYTEVHHPSDVPARRRVSSAHLSSTRDAHSTNTRIRRPKSQCTSLHRPRRVKSAIPGSTRVINEGFFEDGGGSLLCGGGSQQQKTETMRSRRQLMELMGVGKGPVNSEADTNRHKFLVAVQQERERLDVRVKLFLLSCDTVREGGVRSCRKREYNDILLPHTLYG